MLKTTDREFMLVAACCRPVGQAGRHYAIKTAASAPFDAYRVLAVAHEHRVEAFVERGLSEIGFELPKDAAELLAQRVRVARLQMLRNAGEEVRLSGLFRDAGIDCVFVKGATLAMLAHGSLAHKSSWDIDLLVEHRNINQSIDLLNAAGYEFDQPVIGHADLATRFANRYRESSWTNAKRGITVELHWALAHNPHILGHIGIRSERQNVAIGGNHTVPTLSTSDLFAFLVVHGMLHRWSRLKWLTDVAALIEKSSETLVNLIDHAQAANAGRCAAVAFVLMRDLMGVAIPQDLAARIDLDPRVSQLVDVSINEMLALEALDGKPNFRLSHWWRLHTSHLAMAPGLRYRLADVWAKLNEPLVARRLYLPRWLLVPDALFLAIPIAFIRRIAAKF